jgi:hypothetical protein
VPLLSDVIPFNDADMMTHKCTSGFKQGSDLESGQWLLFADQVPSKLVEAAL